MKKNTDFLGIRYAVILIMAFLFSSAAIAEIGNQPDPNDICPTPNCSASNSASDQRDDRYKKLLLEGPIKPVKSSDNVDPLAEIDPGVEGATSRYPMANRNTPAISLVQYFPWLYLDVRGESQLFLYTGAGKNENTRGNNTTKITDNASEASILSTRAETLASLGKTGTGDADKLNKSKCVPIRNTCQSARPDYQNHPVWLRLQQDSCTNQYIAPMGLNPYYIFADALKNRNLPWNESFCQPLQLKQLDCERDANDECKVDTGSSDNNMYDYRAWGYLESSYLNILTKDYFPTGGVSADNHGTNPIRNTGDKLFGKPQPSPSDISYTTEAMLAAKEYGYKIDANGGGINYVDESKAGGSNYNSYIDLTNPIIGKKTTINQLAEQQYERIFDPTHPFSPRWDWKGTDREYSKKANLTGSPDDKIGYDKNLGGDCTVRCAAVPVDILSFRAEGFDACMNCRIGQNTKCFWKEVEEMQKPICGEAKKQYNPNEKDDSANNQEAKADANDGGACGSKKTKYGGNKDGITASVAYNDTLSNTQPIDNHNRKWPLWDSAGNVTVDSPNCKTYYDKKDKWPICSTKYDYPKDNVPNLCTTCVQLSGDSNPDGGVKKCCDNLAKALAPLNTLKIRNTKENPALEPVPEGYRFSDYFTEPSVNADAANGYTRSPDKLVHLPYMRWWDTGEAAGGSTDFATNYNPDCDLGSFDVIVGVGVDGNKGGDGAKYCRLGGNGDKIKYDCYTLPQKVDALTSWEELKLYQANAIHYKGLNCLPQYEKMYKPQTAEDGALHGAGGTYSFPEKRDDGSVVSVARSIPIPWLGYLTDPDSADMFPDFGDGKLGGDKFTGLDNAKVGDIIYMTFDDVAPKKSLSNPPNSKVINSSNPPTGKPLDIFPFAAVVTGTHLNGECNDHLQIQQIGTGKMPDVCGNSSYAGNGPNRRIWKNTLPIDVYEHLYPAGTNIQKCNQENKGTTSYTLDKGVTGVDELGLAFSSNGNCKDSSLADCKFDNESYNHSVWNTIKIYRPKR
ncbi:MAG: hypothetical protein WCJ33_00350 [Pseudomonadota bacterium]